MQTSNYFQAQNQEMKCKISGLDLVKKRIRNKLDKNQAESIYIVIFIKKMIIFHQKSVV